MMNEDGDAPDGDAPSLEEINAARASEQARTASIGSLLEMRKQARGIALELFVQAAGASGLPIPEQLVETVSEKLMDHAIGFLSRLGDDAS